ncbi:MAG TPA: FAD-dependent oxidoreductase [Clostridia bacterium]|nr:FAD-dependent oxidoreductase [Clostridia bacterium]
MKNVVIIGGGYAGVLTAKKLARRLKKNPDVQITLIDKNTFHTMLTELHEVAAGRVEEDNIRIPYSKIFAKRRINFVHDCVEVVDFENRVVRGKKGSYPYDYVVVSAGSRPTYFGVTGAKEHTYPLWSFEDATRLKDRINECFRKASTELDEEEKKKLLSFYVVGAGFTGVEMIGELAEYVPILSERYEVAPSLVSLYNLDVLPRVVPNLPEDLSLKIQRRLEKMGVHVLLGANVVEIGEDFIAYDRGGERTKSVAGTVVWVAGIESSEITQQVGCELPNQKRCRLEADAYLRSTKDERVYIAGDNLLFTAEGESAPVPQMVENCEQSAGTVAHNIVCALTGTGEMETYKPKFHGVMVSVGGRYGKARVGTANHKINLASFFAMFVKHFINIVYFIQVLGWNKIASYLKHEFFTVRNKRSFVGGHFSNRTPSFLLVPLRIWLGAVWVFEGIMKIVEGWLKKPMLEGFFGGATSWFNGILGVSDGVSGATGAAAAASDAVSSATGAATASTGTLLFNINFLGIFKAIFVSGKTLAESTISDYAFKLDIPLMNWFINDVLLPRQGLSLAMQIFIVFAEILIGLGMMGGLFTTLSGLVSLVLLVMFACTTGLYLSTFWMIFAGIAILFGGGQIFGFDYYVMPALKKGWKKIGWVRKSYLYHD